MSWWFRKERPVDPQLLRAGANAVRSLPSETYTMQALRVFLRTELLRQGHRLDDIERVIERLLK